MNIIKTRFTLGSLIPKFTTKIFMYDLVTKEFSYIKEEDLYAAECFVEFKVFQWLGFDFISRSTLWRAMK